MASPRTVSENLLLGGVVLTLILALVGIFSNRGHSPILSASSAHQPQYGAPTNTSTTSPPTAATDPGSAVYEPSAASTNSIPLRTCYALRDDLEVRDSEDNLMGRFNRGSSFSCRHTLDYARYVRVESGDYSDGLVSANSIATESPPSLVSRSSDPRGRRVIARSGVILKGPSSNSKFLQKISPPQQLDIVGRVNGTDYFEVLLRDGSVGYVNVRAFSLEPVTSRQPDTSRSSKTPRSELGRERAFSDLARATTDPTSEALIDNAIVVTPNLINRKRMGKIDYPPSARRAREEGTVHFRLNIDERGRATNCSVLASSGSGTLDSATCSAFLFSARFAPARNGLGQSVSATWEYRMRWSLED